MGNREWTENQRHAIEDRGGSLLLSAAAGSGKTAVLVERAIGLMLDRENPMDADRLLIVSFSKAAAGELRHRLSSKLAELSAEHPGDPLILRQRQLLDRAKISTIHAFCLDLIRDNFQKLELSPGFVIADDSRIADIRQKAMEALLEELYSEADNIVFKELVELFASERDDRKLVETISALYNFIRSHPFYNRWLDEKLALYQSFERAGDSVWGRIVRSYAVEATDACLSMINMAIGLAENCENTKKSYLPALHEDKSLLLALKERADSALWDELCAFVGGLKLARLSAIRGEENVDERELIKSLRTRVKDTLDDLQNRAFTATEQDFEEDVEDLLPKLSELFRATKRYDHLFSEMKKEEGVVDFSDLEQLAITLLVDGEDGCTFTSLAGELSCRYDQIMVDEYQDTNGAQDLIFSAISDGGKKLFMVGDVKQSIYRFRQAMPELFIEKKDRFAPYDGCSHPACITLGHNFRSRHEVTQELNRLFALLMSRKMGEIDYTPDEYLTSAATFCQSSEAGWELHLLDISEKDKEQSAAQLEAEYLARRVKELIATGYRVQDGDGQRPVRAGDVCLLLRSYAGRASFYYQAFSDAGLNPTAKLAGGYLESREISSVLNVLAAIDNPLLDIQLIGAMMSPIFGFTSDEIATIRLCAKGDSFYTALAASAGAGSEKSERFLRFLSEYRRHAALMSVDMLITRLYRDTGFDLMVGSMPQGEGRRANLRLLIEYAATYDRMGYKGLTTFLRAIGRITERGDDLSAAPVSHGEEGVVIMSVHNAKGLEFPVVILANADHSFNREDLSRPTITHPQLGFACMRRISGERRQFVTLPLAALRLEMERYSLSEELRILYVALTRAKEKLIVSAAIKNPMKKVRALYTPLDDQNRLPPYIVGECRSVSDWILMALLHHPHLGQKLMDGESSAVPGFRLCFALPGDVEKSESIDVNTKTALPNREDIDELCRRYKFEYPFDTDTHTAAKLSVSELTKGKQKEKESFKSRPAFLEKRGISPAAKGNAVHHFMQMCDYQLASANPKEELKRLVERGYLTASEGDAVALDVIAGFFSSPLAERMFAAKRIIREHKFIFQPDRELIERFGLSGLLGEGTVVQGIADCFFVEADGGAVIVDYKTDRVKEPDELRERYGMQLLLYKEILEQSLGLSVKECFLYSFYLGSEIKVDLKPV